MTNIRRQLSLLFTVIMTMAAYGGDYDHYYTSLPVPLKAPALPSIPDRTISVEDFGATGDGVTNNTVEFARAIDYLKQKGGGHLNVPPGIYLCGPIQLKSNIDLHLERNAIILFSPDKRLFLSDKSKRATPGISANHCHDISISGQGMIDGNGEWWRAVKRGKVSDVEWKEYLSMGGTTADNGNLWYPYDLKHYGNVAASYEAQEKMREHLIRLTDCERIRISGVTVQNAPKFHIVPQRCHDIVIEGVTVRCPWNAQNGDGIDLMQCREALIVNNTVDVGDDGICLKGGVGVEGTKNGPCENILITDNTVFHAHGGFVIGSEFSGGMFNIIVRSNTFSGTDTGLRFKSGAGRGGKTGKIFISDIMMSDIKDQAIVFETSYADRPVGSSNGQQPTGQDYIPEFSDIHISNVYCRDVKTAIKAKGTVEMIHDIHVENSVFFYSQKGLDVDNPSMVTMKDVKLLSYDN